MKNFYQTLQTLALENQTIEDSMCLDILESPEIDRLKLLDAAYAVRQKYWGNQVTIHIINNAQNGYCPEDCGYCAQAKTSDTTIEKYPIKEESELLEEAKNAYEKGAHRYCMVFAGRGPSKGRIKHLCSVIKTIKETVPIEICLSAGLINDEAAQSLKEAGLDRLNHNLNTSEKNYPNICSTHTYQDRLNTLLAAQKAGIEQCSGVILGMGESTQDVVDLAKKFASLNTASIPVNFLLPVTSLKTRSTLTPDYCLRALCLFRFLNPKAEIRIAAGREYHLRSLEAFGLYPANSLFLDGYLNTKGSSTHKTLEMIKDAGFEIESDKTLDLLLEHLAKEKSSNNAEDLTLKTLEDLRPVLS